MVRALEWLLDVQCDSMGGSHPPQPQNQKNTKRIRSWYSSRSVSQSTYHQKQEDPKVSNNVSGLIFESSPGSLRRFDVRMAPATGPMYAREEKALCFHHELLYEAKVLDSRAVDKDDKKSAYQYKVHYKGWKNTWDDWVPQDRLRKLTDENKELASNLRKEMDAQRRAANKASMPSISHKKRSLGSDLAGSSGRGSEERSSIAPSRGVKRGRDGKELEGIEKEEDFLRRPAIKLYMPDSLKSILVDDWEKVTKEQRLVPLPSKTPVSLFLDEYHDFEMPRRREGSADVDILEEVIAGVKEYFNKCLGRLLLYRFERPQWQDLHSQLNKATGELAGKHVADVYGCEHLLRLFTSMPDLIAHTNMDSQAVSRLREELYKMTQYLSKHADKYFSTEYEHAANDYLDS